MAPDPHRAAATAALVAASLGHGRSLDRLSQGLLLLALAALLLPELGATACGLLLASLIPAGVQAYHAFRCGLDSHIFAHWARSSRVRGVAASGVSGRIPKQCARA